MQSMVPPHGLRHGSLHCGLGRRVEAAVAVGGGVKRGAHEGGGLDTHGVTGRAGTPKQNTRHSASNYAGDATYSLLAICGVHEVLVLVHVAMQVAGAHALRDTGRLHSRGARCLDNAHIG